MSKSWNVDLRTFKKKYLAFVKKLLNYQQKHFSSSCETVISNDVSLLFDVFLTFFSLSPTICSSRWVGMVLVGTKNGDK